MHSCPIMNEKMTESFFDHQATLQCWSLLEEKDSELSQKLIRTMPIQSGDVIMEPGCGAGRITPFLSHAVGEDGWVISYDISSKMIQLANDRRDSPNAIFRKASVHNIPLPNDCIDTAICFNCFHNFDAPSLAVKEISRVLKTGGSLAIAFTEPVSKIDGVYFLPQDKLNRRSIPIPNLLVILELLGFTTGSIIMSDSTFLLIAGLEYDHDLLI